jgi:predicted GIY-YIG superfamily endonuclease
LKEIAMRHVVTIDWEGKSRRFYHYWIYPTGTSFKEEPGNYIFALQTKPHGWRPIYIGQTINLNSRLENHEKEQCAKLNGATHIHCHLNLKGEQARLAEEKDLILKWQPVCNDQLVD